MNSQYLDRLEQRRRREVIDEYQAKGYEVILQPTPADVPEALTPYKLDLLAWNNEEHVVVEISSLPRLKEHAYLPALVEAINTLPQWTLELVTVSPDTEEVCEPDALLLSKEQIYSRLARVHALLDAADFDTAMLLCLTTAEGTLRLLACENQIDLTECGPSCIVSTLYSMGIYGRDEYDVLQSALRYRNMLVHGYTTSQRDPKSVEQLIAVVESLLSGGSDTLGGEQPEED